jgi:hypothetical protein
MKTIIAGSRTVVSLALIEAAVAASKFTVNEVVSGCAPGADRLGEQYAIQHGIPVKPFPADWNDLTHPNARIKTNKYGRKYDANAGHRRNQQMAEYADALIAIWDGSSPGTQDMIQIAQDLGLPLYVHAY